MSIVDHLDRPRLVSPAMLGLFACLAILVWAPFWNDYWGLADDISWLITVNEKVLAGQHLYVEVIETNPPFSVWLYLVPTAVAHRLGIAPELAVEIWTYGLVMLGLSCAARILLSAMPDASPAIWRCLPLVTALLVIFPGAIFGQREHIGAALYLPMLALTICRFERRLPPSLVPTAILAGALGSVFLLVKPYYALIPLFGSLCVAWRHRSIRPIFVTENWVVGVCCLAYLAAVLTLAPEFLHDILPLLAESYLGATIRIDMLVYYGPLMALIAIATMAMYREAGRPRAILIPTSAAVASAIVLFLQGKGWSYHFYPLVLFALATVSFLLVRLDYSRIKTWLTVLPAAVILVVLWQPFAWHHKPDPELVREILDRVPPHPTVNFISATITTGHPLTRALDGRWVSVHNSDWIGANSALQANEAQAAGDLATADHQRSVVLRYLQTRLAELQATKPDIMLLRRDKDWEPYWEADEGIQAFLQDYEVIAERKYVTVMARRSVVAPR